MLRLTLPVVEESVAPPKLESVRCDVPLVESIVAVPCGQEIQRRLHLLREVRRRWVKYNDPAYDFAAELAKHAGDGGSDKDDNADDDGGYGNQSQQQQQQRRRKAVKISEEDFGVDWYDILRVPQADAATDDEIKAAYRRRCLETHPDKQPNHSDELFKLVQRAFDLLGDPDSRQALDSSRPFDDSIPPEDVSEDLFYTSFGPVFERNKKWSTVQGLPSIGDDRTSLKVVKRFYDQWMRFSSWRDFSHEVELEEIDDSMCREEKRFYMRENERQLNVLRRREQKRVQTLVERASKNDPRLRREREAEEAKREKERLERETERQRAREEEDRRRNHKSGQEKREKEEAAKRALDIKNAMRTASKEFKEFFTERELLEPSHTNKLMPSKVSMPNIMWLFSKFKTPEDAQALIDSIIHESADPDPSLTAEESGLKEEDATGPILPMVAAFNLAILRKERETGWSRYGEPVKKLAPEEEAKKMASLTRKVAPAPAPVVSAPAAPAWTEDDVSNLRKAIAKFPGGTVDRWSKIGAMLHDRFTEEEVLHKTKELEAAFHRQSGRGAGADSEATAGADGAAASDVEDWTVKQQQQLEKGLRDLKDYTEKDKFQLVAKEVEGKTPKECFERFKFLRALSKK